MTGPPTLVSTTRGRETGVGGKKVAGRDKKFTEEGEGGSR